MDHLRRIGNSISVQISTDEDGFTGRECPKCEGYFKLVSGTGLKGEGLPCHCPYCGHIAKHDEFWTKEQIEYAKSVALRKITDAFRKDLKRLEFDHKSRGVFGIGISMKVQPGRPIPIHYYREKELETDVACASCTLRYSIYGVFAFCPDCGQHNSLQILDKNLEVVRKMINLAVNAESELAEKLIENALEDCVSAFDGFGREPCRVHEDRASNPAKAKRISFQNLDDAQVGVLKRFGINIGASVTLEAWREAVTLFQKRHLVAHKLGVVDQDYVNKIGDTEAIVGRKIGISASEVQRLANIVRTLARNVSAEFDKFEDDS